MNIKELNTIIHSIHSDWQKKKQWECIQSINTDNHIPVDQRWQSLMKTQPDYDVMVFIVKNSAVDFKKLAFDELFTNPDKYMDSIYLSEAGDPFKKMNTYYNMLSKNINKGSHLVNINAPADKMDNVVEKLSMDLKNFLLSEKDFVRDNLVIYGQNLPIKNLSIAKDSVDAEFDYKSRSVIIRIILEDPQKTLYVLKFYYSRGISDNGEMADTFYLRDVVLTHDQLPIKTINEKFVKWIGKVRQYITIDFKKYLLHSFYRNNVYDSALEKNKFIIKGI